MFLAEGSRTASIQKGLDCFGVYHPSLERERDFRLAVEFTILHTFCFFTFYFVLFVFYFLYTLLFCTSFYFYSRKKKKNSWCSSARTHHTHQIANTNTHDGGLAMSDSAENDGSDEAAASASANASAAAGGGPSGGGGSADNPTVPPLGPTLPTETLRSRNGTEIWSRLSHGQQATRPRS